MLPEVAVRLEFPMTSLGWTSPDLDLEDTARMHVDLVIRHEGQQIAFELKYKTRRIIFDLNKERFVLKDHGAQPPGRYDFMKDLRRLEDIKATSQIPGCAILLTNDSAYWTQPRDDLDTSAAFSLHEGRKACGKLEWSPRTGPGTKKNRETPIQLAGTYIFHWSHYSSIPTRQYPEFKILVVEVSTA